MKKSKTISPQTRNNWLIDFVLFTGAVIASLTGIYFLFLPVGGYQGGRNPMYGVTILFERHTWEDLHLWFGLLMIATAAVHITVHWRWIVSMVRRIWAEVTQGRSCFNKRGRFNLLVNTAIGLSFVITAISGLYFFFFPGGRHGVPDPMLIFARSTWDLLHTWGGIIMIVAAITHFVIHWRWVVKITGKMLPVNSSGLKTKSGAQMINS